MNVSTGLQFLKDSLQVLSCPIYVHNHFDLYVLANGFTILPAQHDPRALPVILFHLT